MGKSRWVGYLLVGLLGASCNAVQSSHREPAINDRQLFIKAEKALQQKQWKLYQALKHRLKHYPLYPYLLYSEYESRLDKVSVQELKQFMNAYPDTPLAEQLRKIWLNHKAKKAHWQHFLQAYQPTENLSLQCHYLWGSLKTQPNQQWVYKQIATLWMSGKTPPQSCEAPFAAWEKSGRMTRPLIWQKVKLLIQSGNHTLARKMSRYLHQSELALVELWLMVRDNPKLVTHRKYFREKHPAHLEMVVDGVSLIAEKKPEEAIKLWQSINRQYPFSERHWGLVVRAIGLTYAKQKNTEAEKWLSRVPNMYATDAVHEWRIRMSFFREDWSKTMHWIDQLPKNLAKLEEWQFWKARSLDLLNRRQESQQILSKLAKSRTYYGLLASHYQYTPYQTQHHRLSVEESLIRSLAKRPSMLRARELHLLNRHAKAKADWMFSTQRMTDKEKHAAARLALEWDLPNWSIIALSKASHKDDLKLRFPLVYTDRIFKEAQNHKIDPAWILAVTRQESAFVPHAKSPVGAAGLMQLMPATAKIVARKKQIPLRSTADLFNPHTNIQLGSGYLKMMLDLHQNNPILATAAYNAGPGRVRQWLPNFDMSADLWIETIPYKETREYVKNVLTYTAVYQEMLGHKASMSRYMRFIPSQKTLVADVEPSTKKRKSSREQS